MALPNPVNVLKGLAQGITAPLRFPAARGLAGAILNPQEALALTMESISGKNIAAAIAIGGSKELLGAAFAAGMTYGTMARNTIFPPKPLPFQSKRPGAKGGRGPVMSGDGTIIG